MLKDPSLSSKERRQLRNKLSARSFRERRKEYMDTLEAEVRRHINIANSLREELSSVKNERDSLKSLVNDLVSRLQVWEGLGQNVDSQDTPRKAGLLSPSYEKNNDDSLSVKSQDYKLAVSQAFVSTPSSPSSTFVSPSSPACIGTLKTSPSKAINSSAECPKNASIKISDKSHDCKSLNSKIKPSSLLLSAPQPEPQRPKYLSPDISSDTKKTEFISQEKDNLQPSYSISRRTRSKQQPQPQHNDKSSSASSLSPTSCLASVGGDVTNSSSIGVGRRVFPRQHITVHSMRLPSLYPILPHASSLLLPSCSYMSNLLNNSIPCHFETNKNYGHDNVCKMDDTFLRKSMIKLIGTYGLTDYQKILSNHRSETILQDDGSAFGAIANYSRGERKSLHNNEKTLLDASCRKTSQLPKFLEEIQTPYSLKERSIGNLAEENSEVYDDNNFLRRLSAETRQFWEKMVPAIRTSMIMGDVSILRNSVLKSLDGNEGINLVHIGGSVSPEENKSVDSLVVALILIAMKVGLNN